ncbi:MAG TPA: invasion associated locus B family protein [Acetobacteraceae bacterium]|jgi:hypothetical protein|nr:invasion associated locus B family protein [Acetobacteraceae bacterium]
MHAPAPILPALLLSVLAGPALAAGPSTAGPSAIGSFGDWTAARMTQAGAPACYAFTRASPAGKLAGRGDVVLSVTERPTGRDSVAISAGYVYPAGATVTVRVDKTTSLDFYTSQRSAFAHDGHAAVTAFERGSDAVSNGPGPLHGASVTDTFSLHGFTAAYDAIVKACPAK